ncbi:MAG: hypothetical protein NXI04_02160 [Planctomycetaceae bacterium]|nr:hypothetical protein [Planctomycetaceae bacterium]
MSQQTETLLNSVLIKMARSFLQYMSEASPWVGEQAQSIGEQVAVLAVRQRQDAALIADLLADREYFVDFGVYPTEYTDQQFLALEAVFSNLRSSQDQVCEAISSTQAEVSAAGDAQAADMLGTIDVRQKELAHALKELQRELKESGASA